MPTVPWPLMAILCLSSLSKAISAGTVVVAGCHGAVGVVVVGVVGVVVVVVGGGGT